MQNVILKTIRKAVANYSGAMEADTISKNGRKSKSQMSRGNTIYKNVVLNCLVIATFVVAVTFMSCGGGSSGSIGNKQISLDKFNERFEEIRNYSTFGYSSNPSPIYANNAASSVNLSKFAERFEEIRKYSTFGYSSNPSYIYASYAASNVPLTKFSERFEEIRNYRTFGYSFDPSPIYASYAASNVPLTKFTERFEEIRKYSTFGYSSNPSQIYASYAAIK